MKCKNCGTESDAEFCPTCGTRLGPPDWSERGRDTLKRGVQGVKLLFGYGFLTLAVPFLAAAVVLFIRPLPAWADLLAVFSLFLGLACGIPATLLLLSARKDRRSASPPRKRRDQDSLREEILKLSWRRRGRLTATDVVAETGLTFKEAETVLNSMVDEYHVSMEVRPSGVIVYEFPEIIERLPKDAGGGGDEQR
ncbi:MAG: hypothetical protein ACUVXI_06170 [bacterium]